jgi:tryptophanyl-tRNA synthetase
MARVLSGIQPTGDLHLGNYLGAVRQWVADQDTHDCYFCVVDLHALTVPRDPAQLRTQTLQTTLGLVAAGLDPDRCTLFVQSHVAEHTRLSWVLECVAGMGELRRMTQFKDKTRGATGGEESARVGLFTYPVLQAADILLYDAERVPVGEEQKQHLELARDLAQRFNGRYGDTFVVPEPAVPAIGARVMDLQKPDDKMSKSAESVRGTVLLLDEPDAIRRKFRRAVTDPGSTVRFDPEHKKGVSNLLQILAAATGGDPEKLAESYEQYGPLKDDTAEAVIELLTPIRERYLEIASDPETIEVTLGTGAAKAREVASATYARARDAVGLLAG